MKEVSPEESIQLDRHERLLLEMDRAYQNGISPAEFRRSSIQDLDFLMGMQKIRNDLREKREHEQKIKSYMEGLKLGRSR